MEPGSIAPEFSLEDKDGTLHTLGELPGDFAVIYFYPKDDTPGCTIQAQQFSQSLSQFAELNTSVVGISGGDRTSKTKFCEKFGLEVLLLSDPDFSVAKQFESYGESTWKGQRSNGVFRNTYVLDRSRRVIAVFEKVNPETHTEEILEFLRQQTKLP